MNQNPERDNRRILSPYHLHLLPMNKYYKNIELELQWHQARNLCDNKNNDARTNYES